MLEKTAKRCLGRHHMTLETSQQLPKGYGTHHKLTYGELPLEVFGYKRVILLIASFFRTCISEFVFLA